MRNDGAPRGRCAPIALLILASGTQTSCAPPPPGASEHLSWLIGRWQEVDGDALTEERWAVLPDGDLLGSGRVLVQGMLGFAETLAITTQGEALVYTAWPAGQDPVPFTSTSVGPAEVVFENPDHGSPHTIRYRRTAGGLEATILGVEEGKPREEKWTMNPVKDDDAPSPAAAGGPGPAPPQATP